MREKCDYAKTKNILVAYTEESPARVAKRSTASQEIPHILCNPKFN